MSEDHVVIDYTNYKGERRLRTIEPKAFGIWYGSNKWHTEDQWLLDAVDVETGKERTFAVKDIHSWQPLTSEPSHV